MSQFSGSSSANQSDFSKISQPPGWIKSRRGEAATVLAIVVSPAAAASQSLLRRGAGHERGGRRRRPITSAVPAQNSMSRRKEWASLVRDNCRREWLIAAKTNASRGCGRFHLHRGRRSVRHPGLWRPWQTQPTESSTPERGGTPFYYHCRAVAGPVEINRLEITVLLRPIPSST